VDAAGQGAAMSVLMIVLLSVSYGLIGVLIACRATVALAWYWALNSWRSDRYRWASITSPNPPSAPSGEQWVGAGVLCLCASLLWPAVAAAYMLRRFLFVLPSEVRELKQAQRIQELEKELALR
jgi:O-antigen/teichoic acid export membrane protein